jgi:hypothetical protein
MPPFGIESSAVTFSVAAAMLGAGAVLAHRYSPALDLPAGEPVRDVSLRLRGMVAWLLAVLVVLAVELWELFHSPRSLYPTYSGPAIESFAPRPSCAGALVALSSRRVPGGTRERRAVAGCGRSARCV